jgi:hypothetical protein
MDQPGMISQRPLPLVEASSAAFWEGARQRRLMLQRCLECRQPQFPPEPSCGHCGHPELEWFEASGRARLYTWTICHPPLLPFFAERAPWAVAAVELEEGVRMVTQVAGIAPERYEIGMPLVADFEDVGDMTLVVFRPGEPQPARSLPTA